MITYNNAVFGPGQCENPLALVIKLRRRADDPKCEWIWSEIDGVVSTLAEVYSSLNHTRENIIILARKHICFRLNRSQHDVVWAQTNRGFSRLQSEIRIGHHANCQSLGYLHSTA